MMSAMVQRLEPEGRLSLRARVRTRWDATSPLPRFGRRLRLVLVASLLGFLTACASDNAPVFAPPATSQRAPVVTSQVEPADPRERARAHTQLAAGYFELGNLSVALEEARIATAADPSYAPAHNVMGLVHMAMRERDQAQASFQRALRADAKDPDSNHNFGWFLCQTGREREAVGYFQNAINNPLYPTPAKSHANAADCLVKAGDLQGAGTHVNAALAMFPLYAPALVSAARLELARGDLQSARDLILRYNRMTEPSADALAVAIQIERRRGDRVAEASYAAQLQRRFPNSTELQDYLRSAKP